MTVAFACACAEKAIGVGAGVGDGLGVCAGATPASTEMAPGLYPMRSGYVLPRGEPGRRLGDPRPASHGEPEVFGAPSVGTFGHRVTLVLRAYANDAQQSPAGHDLFLDHQGSGDHGRRDGGGLSLDDPTPWLGPHVVRNERAVLDRADRAAHPQAVRARDLLAGRRSDQ